MPEREDLRNLGARYKDRLRKALGEAPPDVAPVTTREYDEFKKAFLPKSLTAYEQCCKIAAKVLPLSPDKKALPEFEEAIATTHLAITPQGAIGFSVLAPLLFILAGVFFGLGLPAALDRPPSLFLVVIVLLTGLAAMIPLSKMPLFLADQWRMRASNQMVLSIFYMVTYMRHTSNLELAIKFASDHLSPPLALDFKKILWDVETQQYDSVKEALDAYLEGWRKYNMEFVESIHLIESSLYEASEDRRITALDKALTVMLDETYERMLHYVHNLKSPLTTLHMLGIILPILGLVVLPLLVAFLGSVKWYHLAILYNLLLPISVYYLGKLILSKRPSGYGEVTLMESPELAPGKVGGVAPALAGFFVALLLILVGISPLLLHAALPYADIVLLPPHEGGLQFVDVRSDDPAVRDAQYTFLGYLNEIDAEGTVKGTRVGPYGLGATVFSMAFPLAAGLGFGIYYKGLTKKTIEVRNASRKLEAEFASALFQLGNRLGDGIPAEIAFAKVATVMEGTPAGQFFRLVAINIQRLGLGVETAIFDPKVGALTQYPSHLIESAMKVLVESSKKGPLVASSALINVSQYIKEMHRVDERLRDLMAEEIASMQSQIAFLTPAISGIVIGITSMMTKIISSLVIFASDTGAQGAETSFGGLLKILGTGIPTYYFQIVVGLYVVQLAYILSVLLNGILNGADRISEQHMIGTNLVRSTATYALIALGIMLLFNIIAGSILDQILTGLSA